MKMDTMRRTVLLVRVRIVFNIVLSYAFWQLVCSLCVFCSAFTSTVVGFTSISYTVIEGVDSFVSVTIKRLRGNINSEVNNITLMTVPGTANGKLIFFVCKFCYLASKLILLKMSECNIFHPLLSRMV